MKFPKINRSSTGNGAVRAHIRGALFALVITFSLVLLFAVFVQYMGMSQAAIGPIVQIIKIIAIFVGVMTVLRRIESRAWIHGGILGLVYTVLAFLIFSMITPNFSITSGFLVELLFALVVGMSSAMLLRLRKRGV